MGNKDYEKLNPIYRFATDYCKLTSISFHFDVDSGNYETSIVFNPDTGAYRRPKESETWEDIRSPELMIVPDICDFDNKIIFEFEEETGKRKPGAHMAKKGHGHEGDMNGTRDERRNDCYKKAGFKLLRIWESQTSKPTPWRIMVIEFLINCWRKNMNESMTLYSNIPDIE